MSPRETAMMNAATAIEKEAFRQYRASGEWEEAKDVLEGTDYCRLLGAALAALGSAPSSGWQPIETAPRSSSTPSPNGYVVHALYLLGFCPDESALDPQGCIEVIWWEPHLDGGRWQSAADVPIRPTHWMPLPEAPR